MMLSPFLSDDVLSHRFKGVWEQAKGSIATHNLL